jgi:N-acetyl-anhydromuramyl-L-alanine amidase AmpD
MTAIRDRFLAHPNGYGSRRGVKVDMVVLHTTESSAQSAVRWFADERAKCAAHYVIGPSGLVYEVVPEDMAAWHAGNIVYNRRSVGIEVAGYHDRPETWTPAVVESCGALIGEICRRHDIVPDRAHVVGHSEIPDPFNMKKYGGAGNHVDPGPHTPWTEILAIAQRSVDSTISPGHTVA